MSGGRGGARRLSKLFGSLSAGDRETLLAFAEFLASRDSGSPGEEQAPLEPDATQRPPKESVVAAIKRLSRSYFMLDPSTMLNDTSALMGSHVLHGRSAKEVIDDLETLFERHYARYREERTNKATDDSS